MPFASFCIEIPDGHDMLAELNQFLAGHQVISKQQHLVTREGIPYMLVWLEYVAAKGEGAAKGIAAGRGQEHRDVWFSLNSKEKEHFEALRDLRNQVAQEEQVKPFVIFTNDQLGEMVKRQVTTLAGLKGIPEIGKGRLEKYGERFLEVLRQRFAALPEHSLLDEVAEE